MGNDCSNGRSERLKRVPRLQRCFLESLSPRLRLESRLRALATEVDQGERLPLSLIHI